jgi:hypothetical protein
MGRRRAVTTRTKIPANPGATSRNQFNRPAGGARTVTEQIRTITDRRETGVRK